MKKFVELYMALDRSNKITAKIAALKAYFSEADYRSAAWAVYFLSGRKPRQIVPARLLKAWALQISGIPEWLYDECRGSVGDSSETLALLLPDAESDFDLPLWQVIEEQLLPLRGLNPELQEEKIKSLWSRMDHESRFILNKFISGAFRIGVSQQLVSKSLAEKFEIAGDLISMRMMGEWSPSAEFFSNLVAKIDEGEIIPVARPYPFHLAHSLQEEISTLGSTAGWILDWKWDGIRCQAIKRNGEVFLWSRGEDLITEQFPEIAKALADFPDGTVMDGELVVWQDEKVKPFSFLQKRIGRRRLTAKIISEIPVRLLCFDLLEEDGNDLRSLGLITRRLKLKQLLAKNSTQGLINLVPQVNAGNWEEAAALRGQSRDKGVEGLMLKKADSPYRSGRHRGDWWKWKIDPFTIDGVLMYAQKGNGRRANLYTDYTFAIWKDGELVPFAKAYSGLTDQEIRQVDNFVRRNTKERFGPVCSVEPKLVFELAFEGIQKSLRHKSGIAVRFPRILRWRRDKLPADADSLQAIVSLLPENNQ